MDTTETTRKPPLPEALRRPLVVGDKEQIKALREYEKMIEAIEAENKVFDENVEWTVEISYRCTDTVTVWAKSKKQAEFEAWSECMEDDPEVESCTLVTR